ncbi:MAG: hypothetical protein HHAS10_09310 [Candidatus Altimarinota bacterium]
MKYFYGVFIPFLLLLASCSGGYPIEDKEDFLTFEAKNGFEMLFDSGAKKALHEYYESGTVVINGSYFGQTTSSGYYPAGVWSILGDDFHDDDIDLLDPNLSHIVLYDHEGGWVLFLDRETPLPECAKRSSGATILCSIFQAGPLVLSGGILESFGDSWHANGPHERTLIGITEEGKIYFFLFTEKVTLTEAGEKIREKFPNENMTLLNLDGGPSTAYFDGREGFGQNKKLPIVFRIHM